MIIRHSVEGCVLHLSFPHDLGVADRAAAALQIEALLLERRPQRVQVQLPVVDPSPASLSVIARTRRLCEYLDAPLTVAGPASVASPVTPAAA
ncbi:hypothetical protein [Streptomyces cinereoruber]|uniref:hypothetical protein n=1 Tax=Streptomyces cinereoruber TaxID=67260 RepID=UPI0036390C9C